MKFKLLLSKFLKKKKLNVIICHTDGQTKEVKLSEDIVTFNDIVEILEWDAISCSVYNDDFDYRLSDYIPNHCAEVYIECKQNPKVKTNISMCKFELNQFVESNDMYSKHYSTNNYFCSKIIGIRNYTDIDGSVLILENGMRINEYWVKLR